MVIREGIVPRTSTVDDIVEAKNLHHAILSLNSLITNKTKISEEIILYVQRIITNGLVEPDECGKFRTDAVIITNSQHIPPHHSKMQNLVNEAILQLYDSQGHGILKFIKFKFEFVKIHPFFDGNGRTSRLLLNLLILQQGYVAINIYNEDKDLYYKALEYASLYLDMRKFNIFVLTQMDKTYDDYLSIYNALN